MQCYANVPFLQYVEFLRLAKNDQASRNGLNELGDAFEIRCAHKSLNEMYLYSLHGFINISSSIDYSRYMADTVFGVYSFNGHNLGKFPRAYKEETEIYDLHYVIVALDMAIVLRVYFEYILIATQFSEMFASIVHKKPRKYLVKWH